MTEPMTQPMTQRTDQRNTGRAFALAGPMLALAGGIALVACGDNAAQVAEQRAEQAGAAATQAAETQPAEQHGLAAAGGECADTFANYNAEAAWFCRGGGCNGTLGADYIVDGNPATFSSVFGYDSNGGEVILQVRPQGGVAFPGGVAPGIWLARAQVTSGTVVRRVETLLGGRVQNALEYEESNGFAANVNPIANYLGLQARAPFDELRVYFLGGVDASDMRVFEACVDGPAAAANG